MATPTPGKTPLRPRPRLRPRPALEAPPRPAPAPPCPAAQTRAAAAAAGRGAPWRLPSAALSRTRSTGSAAAGPPGAPTWPRPGTAPPSLGAGASRSAPFRVCPGPRSPLGPALGTGPGGGTRGSRLGSRGATAGPTAAEVSPRRLPAWGRDRGLPGGGGAGLRVPSPGPLLQDVGSRAPGVGIEDFLPPPRRLVWGRGSWGLWGPLSNPLRSQSRAQLSEGGGGQGTAVHGPPPPPAPDALGGGRLNGQSGGRDGTSWWADGGGDRRQALGDPFPWPSGTAGEPAGKGAEKWGLPDQGWVQNLLRDLIHWGPVPITLGWQERCPVGSVLMETQKKIPLWV